MKKYLSVFVLMLAVFCGCSSEKNGYDDKLFDNAEPVDISNVISIYNEYKKTKDIDALYEKLFANDDTIEYELFTDTVYAISLPQYRDDGDEYLAGAEWTYNLCAYTFDIWSNFEMWHRELDNDRAMSSIVSMDSRCIRNDSLRTAAERYKERVLNIMEKGTPGDSVTLSEAFGMLSDMGHVVEKSLYNLPIDREILIDSIDSMKAYMAGRTKDVLEKYINTPEEECLDVMLDAMNSCRSFDDQCSLLFNWADSEKSEMQDHWIMAVAERLLLSGRYNPRIKEVWLLWRSINQTFWHGSSRDSDILNPMYNRMRAKCYRTVLDRVKRHPDDIFAKICAINIGGRYNINRYGRFYYGNDAVVELAELTHGRHVAF